ncbi:hypothetical protein F8388_020547 [Cannabis sativa]|uniref:Uncharacterized protein n=1 Tax=Cannabis sativa TaxID=3483 RepID=A0A7J6EPM7_CANSA|nr:hypothetical protein F8388_020547 [Cannabis sativa]
MKRKELESTSQNTRCDRVHHPKRAHRNLIKLLRMNLHRSSKSTAHVPRVYLCHPESTRTPRLSLSLLSFSHLLPTLLGADDGHGGATLKSHPLNNVASIESTFT